MKELNNERLKEIIAEVRDENSIDPQAVFNNNDILIGNFRLQRESSESQWRVTEVGQANTRDSMQAYFRFRWRGRLGICLKMGKPFLSVLRVDYLTDWIALMIFSTFFFGAPGLTSTPSCISVISLTKVSSKASPSLPTWLRESEIFQTSRTGWRPDLSPPCNLQYQPHTFITFTIKHC